MLEQRRETLAKAIVSGTARTKVRRKAVEP